MRTFTFGFDHKHPVTGESLARHYIQVPGDDEQSRKIMLAVFDRNWSMQYKSPAQFKYPQNMKELKWTEELFEIGRANAYPETLRVLNEYALELAKTEEIDAYFEQQAQLPPVETITGTPIVEYGTEQSGGGVAVWHVDTTTENIYPLGKRMRHAQRYGGVVKRRRLLVIEDWVVVTKEEVDELCKKYDEHMVDFKEGKKGPLLP